MTREHKLALIIGFAVVLLVGVLVSDHFSQARRDETGIGLTSGQASAFGAAAPMLAVSHTPSPGWGGDAEDSQDGFGDPVIDEPRGHATHERSRPTATSVLTGEPRREPPLLGEERVVEEIPFETRVFEMAPAETRDPLLDRYARADEAERSVKPAGDPLRVEPIDGQHRHDVQPGETLSKIAKRYFGSEGAWRKIAAANPGRVDANGNVRSGVTLVIPNAPSGSGRGTAKPATRETKVATRTETKRETKAEPGDRYYTVREGDYLGLISQNLLGTSRRYREIIAMNKDVIDDPDHVPAGTKLRIPTR